MRQFKIILLLLIGFISTTTKAQQPVSIHLTQRDGLPDIEFYDMIKDDDGFLWFAYNTGLCRYDGSKFKEYKKPKEGFSVFNLNFDYKKRLWCTNITGQFYYVKNDSLKLGLDIHKELKFPKGLYNYNFYEDYLIVYGSNFIFSKNLETGKSNLIKNKNNYTRSELLKDTLFLYGTKKNKILVESVTIKGKEISINNYSSFQKKKLAKFPYFFIFKFKDELFFENLNALDKKFSSGIIRKNKFHFFEDVVIQKYKKINCLDVIDNKIWTETQEGAEIFELNRERNTLYLTNHYFPKKNITKVIKDRHNNYWFSTLRNGIYVVPNIHLNTYKTKEGTGNVSVIRKFEDTHIYFGTTTGWLGIYNINTSKTSYIKLNTNSKIRHIQFNKKLNDIYVSSDEINGGFIIDVNNHNKIIKPSHEKSFYGVKGMSLLDNKRLFTVSIDTDRLHILSKGKIDKIEITKSYTNRSYNSYYDSINKLIYITSIDKIRVLDENFKYSEIYDNGKSIPSRCISQTSDGIVWVSTSDKGVIGIRNNKIVRSFTTKNGLLSNLVDYIKADKNSLWIVTKNGLQLMDTKTNNFRNLTIQDGIESFNINSIEIIGNTVWYGSDLGLFSFNKKKVFKTKSETNPYFTSVSIADKIYKIKPSYTLKHDQKRIAIKFHANMFQSSENIRYEYRLLGQSDKWQQVNKGANEVVFNSLEKGKYTFQLRTKNQNIISKSKELKFKITQAFYKEWWFIGVVSIGLILSIIWYYRKQLREQKTKQKLILEKQQHEFERASLKLENLRSQMNPHFIFNALNSIQDYIVRNQKNMAGDYLGKFSELIRLYLDQSSKKEVSLYEEIDTLERYLELEKLRFEDKLIYKLTVDSKIDKNSIYLPTMLLQPYIENSLKHGLLHKKEPGTLTVNFKLDNEEDILICEIIDDGIGRKKAMQIQAKKGRHHKSFATKATEERLKLLNYKKENLTKIFIEDLYNNEKSSNTGTKVTIKIPLD